MKTVIRLAKIPDGAEVLPDQVVMVRRASDGSPMGNLTSDAAGMVTMQQDGHPEPYYFHLPDVPGGDKFWTSTDAKTAGTVVLKELPQGLRAVGDRVIPGVGTEFFLTLVGGGPDLTIGPGAAVAAGHPFVTYGTTALHCDRPVSGILTVRVVIRLCPDGAAVTPGKAELFCHEGVPDGGAPPLDQTSEVWEMPLYTLTIPSFGLVTFTSDILPEAATVTGESRAAGTTTTSVGGASLAGVVPVTLTLPAATTYDVVARLSAVQYATAPQFVLQATYGPDFSTHGSTIGPMITPGQVAVDSSNNVYIADTGNNRLLKIAPNGGYLDAVTGLTGITGVAVTSDGYVFVATGSTIRYFNPSLVEQPSVSGTQTIKHLAASGSFATSGALWATQANHTIKKHALAGYVDAPVTYGSGPGTGDGQLNVPWGIAANPVDGLIYVVSSAVGRMQVFTAAGAFVRQFFTFAASRSVSVDAAGKLWITSFGSDNFTRQTVTGGTELNFDSTDPVGIAVGPGDVVWVGNTTAGTLAKWDETPGGYGEIAIELNGLSSYVGAGNRVGAIANAHSATVTGPATVTVTPYGKATANQMSLQAVTLAVTATPRSSR